MEQIVKLNNLPKSIIGCVAFIFLSTLFYELILIRVLDILWYPKFAYMVFTLALLCFWIAGGWEIKTTVPFAIGLISLYKKGYEAVAWAVNRLFIVPGSVRSIVAATCIELVKTIYAVFVLNIFVVFVEDQV